MVQLDALAFSVERREYSKGDRLCVAGEPMAGLLLLVSGTVALFAPLEGGGDGGCVGGSERALSEAGVGEVIGEAELLRGFCGDIAASRLRFSAVADGNVAALWLPATRYGACLPSRYEACMPSRSSRGAGLSAPESRMHASPQLLDARVPSGLRTCYVMGEGSFAKVALCSPAGLAPPLAPLIVAPPPHTPPRTLGLRRV